jgi:DNA-binding response OmpR family regulator
MKSALSMSKTKRESLYDLP